MFDLNNLTPVRDKHARYLRRIRHLESKGMSAESIKIATEESIKNISNGLKSFVIYGEPQSGKTEMMIALTARLLDEGHKIIILLLNDNVSLLNQNLERFKRSGIDPAPSNFTEVLDPDVKIGDNEWVIFCKKNSKNLQKLIDKIGRKTDKVIIDDEADYATPNSKVNKDEQSKINELVERVIGEGGFYIGVTATPARLDLNRTFENENKKWVDFPPHPYYTGQNHFFPIDKSKNNFRLTLLPEGGDDPKYLRKALFSFLVNVSYLNTLDDGKEENYCMLIHTSGKKSDHSDDYKDVVKFFGDLISQNSKNYPKYVKDIWDTAKKSYNEEADKITRYILENINRKSIIMINCDADKDQIPSATNPATLFTIAIGGNIVSRGVTFKNLLSMFFTRTVKHKMQQDTYIQRARMFGARGKYLKFFELSIPQDLYEEWHNCFVFHKLSLDSIRNNNSSPVWIGSSKTSPAASPSIKKETLIMQKGEMSFQIFKYSNEIKNICEQEISETQKIEQLHELLGNKVLPKFLIDFIRKFGGETHLKVLDPVEISKRDPKYITSFENIEGLGFIGGRKSKDDLIMHRVQIFWFEGNDNARVVYKHSSSLKFLKSRID